jgi:hypothetical protein
MNANTGNCANVVNRIRSFQPWSDFIPDSSEAAWAAPPPFENSELLPGQIFVVPNVSRASTSSVLPKALPTPYDAFTSCRNKSSGA